MKKKLPKLIPSFLRLSTDSIADPPTPPNFLVLPLSILCCPSVWEDSRRSEQQKMPSAWDAEIAHRRRNSKLKGLIGTVVSQSYFFDTVRKFAENPDFLEYPTIFHASIVINPWWFRYLNKTYWKDQDSCFIVLVRRAFQKVKEC